MAEERDGRGAGQPRSGTAEEWDDQSCLTASSSKDADRFLFCGLGFYRDMSMCLLSVI